MTETQCEVCGNEPATTTAAGKALGDACYDKALANARARRAAQAAVRSNTFPNLMRMFEDNPKLDAIHVPGLKISRAKARSANAGCLYVTGMPGSSTGPDGVPGREYYGKLTADGTWRPVQAGHYFGIIDAMELVDEGGNTYLAQVGRETGICCFCGMTLTDPESIARGYGPVCARNNGLPHGNKHGF
jgi:hypothetical protein